MDAGKLLRMERGRRNSFTGVRPALLLEVSRPSLIHDNNFDNPDIPIGGNDRRPTQ